MTEITLDGQTYRQVAGGWINAETFLTPPEVIVRRLNTHLPAQPMPSQKRSSSKRSRSRPRRRAGFDGLKPTDFKDNVTGTNWRRKDTLAGMLAQRLTDAARFEFTTYAYPRAPIVYIYDPRRAPDGDDLLSAAKFDFRLNGEGAAYGYLVERQDKPMPAGRWDWFRFQEALADPALQGEVAQVMGQHDLKWQIIDPHDTGPTGHTAVSVSDDGLLWQAHDGEATITWPDFLRRLDDIPSDRWINLYLQQWADRETAVEAGVGIVETAVAVYRALLPLYEASTSGG